MKKLISKIMAFVIIMGCISPYCIVDIFGADLSLKPSSTIGMTVGDINPTPKIISDNVLTDQSFIEWSLDGVSTGEYLLEFPLKDGYKANLQLVKDINNMNVYYDVLKYNGFTYENINTTTDGNYAIHTDIESRGVANYKKAQTYFSGGFNLTTPDYTILKNDDRPGHSYIYDTNFSSTSFQTNDNTKKITPMFTVSKNRGYSFFYFDNYIHLKWNVDGAGKQSFYFTIDKINPGKIYDFTLKKRNIGDPWPIATDTANFDTKYVCNGIDKSAVIITPIANDTKTASDSDYIDMTLSPNVPPPGSPKVKFNMEFPLPKSWGTWSFDQNPDGSFAMPLVLSFGNKDSTKAMQLQITDSAKSPSTSLYDFKATGEYQLSKQGIEVEKLVRDNNKIILTLSGLDNALIFHETKISIGSSGQLTTKMTGLPYGQVYTFPYYDVSPLGEEYVITVHPFVGIPGYYKLMSGDLQGNNYGEAETKYEKGDRPVKFALNQVQYSTKFYKILFSPTPFTADNSGTVLSSQQMKFKAEDVKKIGIPEFFNITKDNKDPVHPAYYQIPTDYAKANGELYMTLNWDLGSVENIDKMLAKKYDPALNIYSMDLVYGINYTLTPQDIAQQENTSNDKMLSDILLHITALDPLSSEISEKKVMVKYSSISPLDDNGFNITTPSPVELKVQYDPKTGKYRYVAVIDVKMNIAKKDTSALKLQFPNIYFLNVNPKMQDGNIIALGPSLYDSITLNDLSKLEVPPPQNMKITNVTTTNKSKNEPPILPKDETSFTLNFEIPRKELSDYTKNSFGILSPKPDVKVNFYISQDEKYMREKFSTYSGDPVASNVEGIINYGWISRYENDEVATVKAETIGNDNDTNILYFSSINGINPSFSNATINGAINPYDINILRETAKKDGKIKVLRIEEPLIQDQINSILNTPTSPLNLNLKFDGLDKNEKYYIYADIQIDVFDPVANIKIHEASNASLLTDLQGVTTKGDKEVPQGKDKYPKAPELNKPDVKSLDSATIFWPPIPSVDEGETIEYQIIRTRNTQIPANVLNNRDEYTFVWDETLKAYGEKFGFMTKGDNILMYDPAIKKFIPVDKTKYSIELKEDGNLYFTDKTLSPNDIYFYYVRTVKKEMTYSVWSEISITTDVVKSPKNLNTETERKDYNTKTEMIISFDAPVSEPTNIGSLYNLVYSIKKDEGQWSQHITMVPSALVGEKSTEVGYFHFTYKILGLDSGSRYSIKVKIVDKNKNESQFSNMAIFKTDVDQEKTDIDKETQDWIDYLKNEMDKLIKKPYWISNYNMNKFEVIFRQDMFETVINTTTGSNIVLPTDTVNKSEQYVYYIPAPSYKRANDKGKGFTFTIDNTSILIPPDTIDTDNNMAILSLEREINKNNMKDYYVKISVKWSKEKTLQGVDPLKDIGEISVELVGINKNIEQWDKELLYTLIKKTEEYAAYPKYKDVFTKGVKDKISNEELSKYVLNILKETQDNIVTVTNSNFHNKYFELAFSIGLFDKPVNLSVIPAKDVSISVFQYINGNLNIKEIVSVGEGQGIETTEPGVYYFIGRIINIPGIENVEKGGTITSIVAKYGLDDYLGKGPINLQNNVTMYMLVGSASRIAGAPKDADPFKWLKDHKGIVMSSKDVNSEIETQEALHMFVNLYEIKTHTKASTIKIRNHNAAANIDGINSKYKESVKAAMELKLYPSDNFNPKKPISIKEFLDILGRIDNITKLK